MVGKPEQRSLRITWQDAAQNKQIPILLYFGRILPISGVAFGCPGM